MSRRVMLYKRYERFWHWMQALLVIALIITGFEVHGSFSLLGFEQAVWWHTKLVWAFIILTAFTIFWDLTTGEWRHYVPTKHNVIDVMRYYLVGIFHNEPHPTKKTELSKLNPLQRLTYLGLKLVVFPIQLITGFLYYFYNDLPEYGIHLSLKTISTVHIIAAFMTVVFVIAHIYLTTTGHTVFSNLKAMITGWEEVEEETAA